MRSVWIKYILSIVLLVISSTEFSYGQSPMHSDTTWEDIIEMNTKGYYAQMAGIDPVYICNTKLYETIEYWIGTPYKYAGSTEKGIDCSSFVNMIYSVTYSHRINGNSVYMYRSSSPVGKKSLDEGDLVFFRTTRKRPVSHVGIYLGNDKFAHASRSKGVTISDLNSPYYKTRFVRGGRIEIPD